MTFMHQKNTIADVFQIDDVIISFKGIFDKINDLSKPSTDIWNNNKKTYLEGTVKASSTNVCRICLGKLQKKLLSDFIRESYFLYDKSNLIQGSFITEINELISIYGSISYFVKKT